MWADGAQDRRRSRALLARRELRAADAADLRDPGVRARADAAGARPSPSRPLEITTCLRRGEIEIATVFEPAAAADYDGVRGGAARAPRRDACSPSDGSTIDEIVAGLLLGPPGGRSRPPSRARAGCWRRRLTDRAGLVGLRARRAWSCTRTRRRSRRPACRPALIERVGAVSPEVAGALADGARERFGADVGDRHHRDRRARAAARRRSRSARSASAWRRAPAADRRARCSSRATAPTSATARRRVGRCTCCAGCCSASRERGPAPALRRARAARGGARRARSRSATRRRTRTSGGRSRSRRSTSRWRSSAAARLRTSPLSTRSCYARRSGRGAAPRRSARRPAAAAARARASCAPRSRTRTARWRRCRRA